MMFAPYTMVTGMPLIKKDPVLYPQPTLPLHSSWTLYLMVSDIPLLGTERDVTALQVDGPEFQ